MKKLISQGLVMVAGIVPPPAGAPASKPVDAVAQYREDTRLEALRGFFERADCPAAELSPVFLEAADDHNLDWRLLPSISFVESTGGKAAKNNNLFGWDSGRAVFSSATAGIHTVAFRLAHSRRYRGKDVDQILEAYNPDATYARKVKSVMRRIAPSE